MTDPTDAEQGSIPAWQPPSPGGAGRAGLAPLVLYLGLALAVSLGLGLAEAVRMTRIVRTGTFEPPYLRPWYDCLPVPRHSGSTEQALGADFCQVYFSALALRHGQSAYEPDNAQFRDPLGRRPNYPPLVNWAYVPLTFLRYEDALIVHNFGSMFLFVAMAVVMLHALRAPRDSWVLALPIAFLTFLTCIGQSHFERGQFDFLSAGACFAAFALLFSADTATTALLVVLAGLLGAAKWTSGPFLGTFCGVCFVASGPGRRWRFAAVAGVILLSVALLWQGVRDYWPSIEFYELNARTAGVSLRHFLPAPLSKSVQVICAALVLVALRRCPRSSRESALRAASLPFAVAMMLQGFCFCTISYEYRAVCLLGMLPCVGLWCGNVPEVRPRYQAAIIGLLGVFLLIAFRVYPFVLWLSDRGTSLLYFAVSLMFLGFGLRLISCAGPQRAPSGSQGTAKGEAAADTASELTGNDIEEGVREP